MSDLRESYEEYDYNFEFENLSKPQVTQAGEVKESLNQDRSISQSSKAT